MPWPFPILSFEREWRKTRWLSGRTRLAVYSIGKIAQLAFCSAMERLKEVPVHVHCIANYRVSAFFYRYRRDVLGTNEAEARAEMEQVWRPEGVWATFVARQR